MNTGRAKLTELPIIGPRLAEIGDIVDGRLARALNATSSLGAQLDSIADTLLFLAAAGGIAVFHAEVISKHPVVFTLVPSAWIAENLVALWRYGRLSSFHTYLSRAAAVAMGLFVGCCRARGTDRNWTRVDRKMLWSPAASSSQQRARVLTDVKARRFAPHPLRGADGLDAGSAHARPDWLLPTMLTHTPPTC